jgi:peroxiredoxin Q/BCP
MASKTVALDKVVPAFSAPATGNGAWKLSDLRGRNLVIYFYPKDNTPGCTQEGADFRDLYPQFKKAKTEVVGVSTDSLTSHEKFIAKMSFPFRLLSDPERKICELFDVYREKTLYGRKYMGIERSTFLLDAKGVLRQEWRKLKVKGHAAEVLAAAAAL